MNIEFERTLMAPFILDLKLHLFIEQDVESIRSDLSHHCSKNCSPGPNLKPDPMDVAARDDLLQAWHA